MKAYPDDLRKKVLTAYQEGKGSVRQLTVKSGISPTSVSGLIKNFRRNGHIRPEPHGGGQTPAVNGEGRISLTGITAGKPDPASEELCGYHEDRTGKKVGRPAPDRTSEKTGMTREKKVLHDPEKNTDRVGRLTEEYSGKAEAGVPDNPVFTDGNRSGAGYDSSLRKITGRGKSNRNPSCVPGAEDIGGRSAVGGRNGSLYDFRRNT
jgi:transposase